VVLAVDLVNTDAAAKTVNLYFKESGGTSRKIVPEDLSIDAGYHYQRTGKITMAEGDEIEGDASTASVVDYMIPGVEI
jgi:hypothetical protein